MAIETHLFLFHRHGKACAIRKQRAFCLKKKDISFVLLECVYEF